VKENTESLGTLFDPIPSSFQGNIHSSSSPQEIVLGYFSVGATKKKRIFINYHEVMDLFKFNRACTYDSIGFKDLDKLERYERLLQTIGDPPSGYAKTIDQCADCTLYGTNIKPDYWE